MRSQDLSFSSPIKPSFERDLILRPYVVERGNSNSFTSDIACVKASVFPLYVFLPSYASRCFIYLQNVEGRFFLIIIVNTFQRTSACSQYQRRKVLAVAAATKTPRECGHYLCVHRHKFSDAPVTLCSHRQCSAGPESLSHTERLLQKGVPKTGAAQRVYPQRA